MHPDQTPCSALYAGQVGYVILGMKSVRDALIGDTFYHPGNKSSITLYPNFDPPKSMAFSGLYPIDTNDYYRLQEALDRLTLNDASVSVHKESSMALGQGFRVGFLGRLHMDVFRQRLEEEYGATVINTLPTVPYKLRIQQKGGSEVEKIVQNPADYPEGKPIYNPR